MTIDRLLPMLHIIATTVVVLSYNIVLKFLSKEGKSYRGIIGRILLRWLRGDLTTLRPEVALYTQVPPRTLTLCDSYSASHDS